MLTFLALAAKRRFVVEAYDDEAVPNDIRALLTKSLSSRPRERFSSASDFKKELDRLLYGGAYSPTTFNLALFMDRLFRVLPAIAASPSTVLILGETGTGKELVARTIHALSPRSAAPFMPSSRL